MYIVRMYIEVNAVDRRCLSGGAALARAPSAMRITSELGVTARVMRLLGDLGAGIFLELRNRYVAASRAVFTMPFKLIWSILRSAALDLR
jgi:hypothetical protein